MSLRGFTLLELLIAVTIFSIVAVAIYASFNVGIHAWRKAENSYKIRQEARHILDSIGRDLKNAVNFTPMPFEGSSNYVSFSRALKILKPEDEYLEGIFKTTYTFDAGSKTLYYILQTYQESASGESPTKSLLTSGILDFRLKYAYRNGEEVTWKDNWAKEDKGIPFGVKLSLSYPPQAEGEVVLYSETILIPTGTLR